MSTFSVAGTSRLNGIVKVRFANNLNARALVLGKNGHEDINLIDFGMSFSKEELVEALLNHENITSNADSFAAVTELASRKFPQLIASNEQTETESI